MDFVSFYQCLLFQKVITAVGQKENVTIMKKLIELDAALDALREVIVPAEDIGFGDELTEGYNDGINMAVTVVSGLPSVDAVPVDDVFELAIALNKEIEVLGLSVRAYNALSRWGCRTVGDVYRLWKSGKIKKVRNLGDKSIGEIEDGLYEYLPYLWQTEGR